MSTIVSKIEFLCKTEEWAEQFTTDSSPFSYADVDHDRVIIYGILMVFSSRRKSRSSIRAGKSNIRAKIIKVN